MTPPSGCPVASVLSPFRSSCRVGSSSPMDTDLAVLGGLRVPTKAQNIMRITISDVISSKLIPIPKLLCQSLKTQSTEELTF